MSSRIKTTGALFVLLTLISQGAGAPLAHAGEDACDSLVQYLWNFQPGVEPAADQGWSKLSQLNAKLHKGTHRLAAPGTVDPSSAYPFPGVPSAVQGSLDRETFSKVKSLYDKYVLLERSIDDTWKDRFSHNDSSTMMQRFATERTSTLAEMSRIAKSAKEEVVRYAFRTRNCFDTYEAFVSGQTREIKQQLANAQSTLRANEEIWAHAQAPAVPEAVNGPKGPALVEAVAKPEPVEQKRLPASMPAIVTEDIH